MRDSKKGKQKHWSRPLGGKWRGGQHLLLWPEENTEGKRVRSAGIQAIYAWLSPEGDLFTELLESDEAMSANEALEQLAHTKGTLTVWIPGGWDHLVLTGLAELMDRGIVTWHYCALESHRVLIRGLWRGKAIIITSLANWTGATWDRWATKTAARGVDLYVEVWKAVALLSRDLQLGSLAPSAGAAGLLLWRSWLGPRVGVLMESPSKLSRGMTGKKTMYVAPLPSRPERCRHAERHTAYGLVHRQMREGKIEGPVYCVDCREAYLCGLMTMVVPIMYSRTLHEPSTEELAASLDKHTGCALVQLRSPETAYPTRRNGRNLWATGEYWTWLAGIELASAVYNLQAVACKCAYIWSGFRYHHELIGRVLTIGYSLQEKQEPLQACAWRSVYSQLVGRFAAWRKRWVDTTAAHNFGRWAYWHGINAESGQPQAYRSVAGRVQKLQSREDSGDSVALLFASVTAQCRYMLARLGDLAGRSNVLAIEADALWLTPAGWQALQRRCSECGIPPDNLRCKETFSHVWMTGKAIAVVEVDGQQYLRCPGVPADIAVGATGDVRWPQTDDWHRDNGPDQKRGVRRLERRYSAKEIMKVYDHPATVLPYTDELIDPALPEQLLQPLGGPERGIENV